MSLETKKTACTMPGQLTPGDTIYSVGKQGRTRVNHKQHRGLGTWGGRSQKEKTHEIHNQHIFSDHHLLRPAYRRGGNRKPDYSDVRQRRRGDAVCCRVFGDLSV
jgi:hypothetical protein